MELKRCPNGHYYDESKHSSCPYCGTNVNMDIVNGRVNQGGGNDLPETRPLYTAPAAPGAPEEPKTTAKSQAKPSAQNKTVGFYHKKVGIDPVVGWLLCVDGPEKGRDYRMRSGRNTIGRAENMDICIAGDNSISRDRHALIAYDPKKVVFMLQPGDSREMCYVNDEGVYAPVEIKAGDVIELGETKLRFYPACGEDFKWD